MSVTGYNQTLDGFRELAADWDSYGASVIDRRVIEVARTFLAAVVDGSAQVVPTRDGGVQVEVHRDGFDIEVEFDHDAEIVGCWDPPEGTA